jgi:SAM-dependent methyltransferase
MPHPLEHDTVRRSYNAVARQYQEHFSDELSHKPIDRALLAALIDQTDEGAPIVDLGCGPGHVTAWLADHGAASVGIDLSPKMIEIARLEHPGVVFREGDLLSLPAKENEFGAAVAFYSIIHLEPSELHPAFDEIRRVVKPAGLVLVAFHVGSEVRHTEDWWGQKVDLDFRFLETERVIEHLESVGFALEAKLERRSHPEEIETSRAYLLVRLTS